MTQAQADAHLCGISPEDDDPRFFAQHLCAYAFATRYAAGKRVLDVGFGEGYGANHLADVAQEVVGIDGAPGNIPRASTRYSRPNLRFHQMDATRLEFPDESFDLVCSFQVIEHIPEPLLLRYLGEMARVQRPDGVCCITTLNLAHNMKPGKPYEKLIHHEKEFTEPELRRLLEEVFPHVELYGLHLTRSHRLYQRLKKWGLDRLQPNRLNPVRRFYQRMSVEDFTVCPDSSRSALDLYAVCRKR